VAGIAPFVGLREDFAAEEIRVQPAGVTDNGGRVAVRLDGPRRVYAIRMPMVRGAGSPTTTGVRISWQGRERGTGLAPVPTSRPGEPEARTATVWINDVIDGFWIESEDPEALRDRRLVLVTP
jgi:hypothetical protein